MNRLFQPLVILLMAFCLGLYAVPPAHALAVEEAEQMGRDAVAAHAAGNLAGAEETLQAAFALLGEDGKKPGSWQGRNDTWKRRTRLYLLRELADLRLTQGRPQQAKALLKEASALAQGDAREEAHVFNQQGLADWRGGELSKALAAFSLAKIRYDGLGIDYAADQAMVRGNLGLVQLDSFTAGGPDHFLSQAEESFSQALDGFIRIGQQDGISNQWSNLGLVYRLQGRLAKAEDAHKKALALEKSLGNRIGEIDTLGSLGRVAEERGDLEQAKAFYIQAFDLSKAIGYARGISHHGYYVATVFQDLGDWAAAKRYGAMALEAAEAIGNTEVIKGLQAVLAKQPRP